MSWAAIILAAGRSSRMGNSHKLLEELRCKPLINHVIDAAEKAFLAPLLLVTGYRQADVSALAHGHDIEEVFNPDYASGMMSSVVGGLRAVPETCQGAVILLGDMPMITPQHIRAAIAALQAKPEALAAVPVYRRQWGHPVVMRRGLFGAVMGLSGDHGARAVLKAHLAQVVEVPIDDPAILLDLDTPEALALARQSGSARLTP
jgi:molybdenum cofactor cytidylyltransferase